MPFNYIFKMHKIIINHVITHFNQPRTRDTLSKHYCRWDTVRFLYRRQEIPLQVGDNWVVQFARGGVTRVRWKWSKLFEAIEGIMVSIYDINKGSYSQASIYPIIKSFRLNGWVSASRQQIPLQISGQEECNPWMILHISRKIIRNSCKQCVIQRMITTLPPLQSMLLFLWKSTSTCLITTPKVKKMYNFLMHWY